MLAFDANSELSNTTGVLAPGPLRRNAAGTEIGPAKRDPDKLEKIQKSWERS